MVSTTFEDLSAASLVVRTLSLVPKLKDKSTHQIKELVLRFNQRMEPIHWHRNTSAADLIMGNKRAVKRAEASDRQSRISSCASRNDLNRLRSFFVPKQGCVRIR